MGGRKLFGTDGVRGQANRYPLTSEVALKLGKALVKVLKPNGKGLKIVIGKDTRISGYMLETALSSCICSMGADVYLVGPLATPGVAFITSSMRADAGVVISASHNPFYDNGIKFFDGGFNTLTNALPNFKATSDVSGYLFACPLTPSVPNNFLPPKIQIPP